MKDWTQLTKQYKGLWVALADDEETVLESGRNAREVYDRAKERGCKTPLLARVPKKEITYVGRCS